MKKPQHLFKYIIGFIICIGIRLIPFRPPNVEPIMTTTMPFSKKWGWLAGGIFGALSIVLYDLINPTPGFARWGTWTWITAAMYGLVGIGAGIYFKKRKSSVKGYVLYAILATLVFDFITGPIMSSMVWNMPFSAALVGQIPFTLWHVGGNAVFAATISPLVYKWVVTNKHLELDSLAQRLKSTV